MQRGLFDEADYAVGSTLAPSRAWAYDTPIVKPTPDSLFLPRGTNAEMRWEAMRGQGYLTPVDRFFVRNHTATLEVDHTSWRLRVHGSGVRRELSLSYEDLLRMPSVTVNRFIECAGNGRSLFDTQQHQPAPGTEAYPDQPLVTTQVVKSALELPFPATLTRGRQRLTGRSWSGHGRVRRVEVSIDGRRWRPADLGHRDERFAWRRWSFRWEASPGNHDIRVRATEDRGNVQPAAVPFNEQGYLFGAVVAHPVTVAQ